MNHDHVIHDPSEGFLLFATKVALVFWFFIIVFIEFMLL